MSLSESDVIVSSLGSGSNGNAFLLEYGNLSVLIDAGVPIRTLLACLDARGLKPDDLDAILLSHEHSDHVQALPGIMRRSSPPVFATEGTHAGTDNHPIADRRVIREESTFVLNGIDVTPIPVAHDAREPVGFFLRVEDVTVAIMSDLGEVSDINADFASRASHLIIESNYDESMLRSGPYPAYLKRRIRSSDGHLSNEDCATFLCDIVSQRTGGIWLCHLSENNNRPELALKASTRLLSLRGQQRQIRALPRYDGTVVTWRSSETPEFVHQSTLPF